MSELEKYKVGNYTNVLVWELNHVNSLDEEENEHNGFKKNFLLFVDFLKLMNLMIILLLNLS